MELLRKIAEAVGWIVIFWGCCFVGGGVGAIGMELYQLAASLV